MAKKRNRKTIELAKLLLKNTGCPDCEDTGKWDIVTLREYIKYPYEMDDREIKELTAVFELILRDGYDISGFVLDDCDWFGYAFYNKAENKLFDVYTKWGIHKETVIGYMKPNPKRDGMLYLYKASCIEEAIEKFDWQDAGIHKTMIIKSVND